MTTSTTRAPAARSTSDAGDFRVTATFIEVAVGAYSESAEIERRRRRRRRRYGRRAHRARHGGPADPSRRRGRAPASRARGRLELEWERGTEPPRPRSTLIPFIRPRFEGRVCV
eukprot:30831-Pelagococcus_subviridis.AAC.8